MYALRVHAVGDVWDCIWVLLLEESEKVLIAELRELRWCL